jgi:Icc-related predicted phosphoesterase
MKILCVSDHVDPLVYSAAVKERFAEVELVISAGDLPMEYLGFISSSLNKPVLFVFGNHNLKFLHRFDGKLPAEQYKKGFSPQLNNYFGATYIDNRLVRLKGLLIAGLGGSRRYNRGENQFTERQMFFKMLRLIPMLWWNKVFRGRYLDILVTHAAPFGIHDKPDPCHVGFRVFLWFLRQFRPRYLLHGHIHLYDLNARRESTYKGTTIINVYDHYVLEVEEDNETVCRPDGD